MNKKLLGILCVLAIITSYNIFAQSANEDGNLTDDAKAKAQETYQANADADGNIQANMNIVIGQGEDTPYYAKDQAKDDNGNDRNFRGNIKDGEDATIHYIEDNAYSMHENSLTYRKSGEEVGNGSELTGSPNINWTIDNDDDDESGSGSSSDNSNAASKDCTFADAGTYSVHNSGSRQLTEADGVGGSDDGDEDGGKKEDEKKYITAEGRIPVKIHDVTPPDVWIAFQENEINTTKLVETLEYLICHKDGVPLEKDAKDEDAELSKTSFIFIDEGKLYPKPEGYDQMSEEEKEEVNKKIQEETVKFGRRDQEYPYKSVRVTMLGSIFDENGVNVDNSAAPAIVHTIESDRDNLNREANCDFISEVKRKEDNQEYNEIANQSLLTKKYAVYARRNVPLLPIVTVSDNGNKRDTSASLKPSAEPEELTETNQEGTQPEDDKSSLKNGYFKIYTSNDKDALDGEPVNPEEDGSYLFRVANYPRKDYEDQPYYFFETEVKDSSMNATKVRIPLYVINSSASFEESRK